MSDQPFDNAESAKALAHCHGYGEEFIQAEAKKLLDDAYWRGVEDMRKAALFELRAGTSTYQRISKARPWMASEANNGGSS